jgi:hypothetical protein
MPLVGVCDSVRMVAAGLGSDWRIDRGEPGNDFKGGATAGIAATALGAAMSLAYSHDAHCVAYVVGDDRGILARYPRLRKSSLGWVRDLGYWVEADVLLCDIDRPGHAEWSTHDEAREAVEEAHEALERAATVYATRSGLRVIQSMVSPLAVDSYEPALDVWRHGVERAVGMPADIAARDWTRLYRLPRVTRDGREQTWPVLTSDEVIEPPRAPAPVRVAVPAAFEREPVEREPVEREPVEREPVEWADSLPEELHGLCEAIAERMPDGDSPSWHDTHLAIAGALMRLGVPDSMLPEVARRVAALTYDTRPDDRAECARSTVDAARRGSSVRGVRWLVEHVPALGELMRRLLGRDEPPAPAVYADAPTPLELVAPMLADAIRSATERLTCIIVPPGTGKTHAARAVASERAKDGKKTGIAVPTHALAEQIQRDLELAGTPALRLVGIASARDEDGWICRYRDQAAALSGAGLSARAELCEGRGKRCEYYDGCSARIGQIGPPDALVTIGPHALAKRVSEAAGTRGLLVVDEPPEMVDTVRVTVADLEYAYRNLGLFAPTFARGMLRGLAGVRALLDSREDGDIALGAEVPDWETCVLDASEACSARDGGMPALDVSTARRIRVDPRLARDAARAGRVLSVLRRLILHQGVALVQLERGELVITWLRQQTREVLGRQGPVVAMGADLDAHEPTLTHVLGYVPTLVRVEPEETADVRRIWIRTASASRTTVVTDDGVRTDIMVQSLQQASRAARDWLGTMVDRALVVTHRTAMDGIQSTLVGRLELQTIGAEVMYYGALRGLDRWADCQLVITIGDPRPNIGEISRRERVAPMPSPDTLAACELEQAHGRLRTVHRRGRMVIVHVGSVRPRGRHWLDTVSHSL